VNGEARAHVHSWVRNETCETANSECAEQFGWKGVGLDSRAGNATASGCVAKGGGLPTADPRPSHRTSTPKHWCIYVRLTFGTTYQPPTRTGKSREKSMFLSSAETQAEKSDVRAHREGNKAKMAHYSTVPSLSRSLKPFAILSAGVRVRSQHSAAGDRVRCAA
jgi:hypothetical protein